MLNLKRNFPEIYKHIKNIEKDLVSVENENETHIELTLTLKGFKMIISCEMSKDVFSGKIKTWLYYVAIRNLKGCWNPTYSIDDEMQKYFSDLRVCQVNSQGREIVKEVADETDAKAMIENFLNELNRLMPVLKVDWEREADPGYGFGNGKSTNMEVSNDNGDKPF